MRYERSVNIKFDHSCRAQDIRTIETNIHLVIDFEVRDTASGLRVVDVTRTRQRFLIGNPYDAEWWWDLCPHGLRARLDAEMLAAWDRVHGLVVERVTA